MSIRFLTWQNNSVLLHSIEGLWFKGVVAIRRCPSVERPLYCELKIDYHSFVAPENAVCNRISTLAAQWSSSSDKKRKLTIGDHTHPTHVHTHHYHPLHVHCI